MAIPIQMMVETLDVSEECLGTLLCYLELHGRLVIKGSVRDICTIRCFGGSRQVKALAWQVPAVAAAVSRVKEKGMHDSMWKIKSTPLGCGEITNSSNFEHFPNVSPIKY